LSFSGGDLRTNLGNIAPPAGTLLCFARYLAEVKRLQHCNPLSTTLVGLVKCLCQPPLVGNWAKGLGGRLVLRHCAFSVYPHRPANPSTWHWPGWQQSWWNGMHCTPSWLRGRGRHCVSHNAPVEYKKPCSCYFPLERDLLRMTHCYIN